MTDYQKLCFLQKALLSCNSRISRNRAALKAANNRKTAIDACAFLKADHSWVKALYRQIAEMQSTLIDF